MRFHRWGEKARVKDSQASVHRDVVALNDDRLVRDRTQMLRLAPLLLLPDYHAPTQKLIRIVQLVSAQHNHKRNDNATDSISTFSRD